MTVLRFILDCAIRGCNSIAMYSVAPVAERSRSSREMRILLPNIDSVVQQVHSVVFVSIQEVKGVQCQLELRRTTNKEACYAFSIFVPSKLNLHQALIGIRLEATSQQSKHKMCAYSLSFSYHVPSVVNISSAFFKKKLDPIVESADSCVVCLSNKHMFKSRRIIWTFSAVKIKPESHELLAERSFILTDQTLQQHNQQIAHHSTPSLKQCLGCKVVPDILHRS